MSEALFPPERTLAEAATEFFDNYDRPQGATCPCCDRHGKLNVVTMTKSMIKNMAWLARNEGCDRFVHLPTEAPRSVLTSNNMGKLRHWGFTRRRTNDDEPDKNHTGWHMVTSAGIAFLEGRIRANSAAFIYDDRVMQWREDQVTVSDVLKTPFNFRRQVLEDSARG